MNWFDIVRQGLIVAGGVGAIAFPIYYWACNPQWYRDEMSRFLMLGGLGWASLYSSGIMAIVFPSEVVRDVIRLVLIVGAGSFAWYQVWMLYRVRREGSIQRKRKEGTDATE